MGMLEVAVRDIATVLQAIMDEQRGVASSSTRDFKIAMALAAMNVLAAIAIVVVVFISVFGGSFSSFIDKRCEAAVLRRSEPLVRLLMDISSTALEELGGVALAGKEAIREEVARGQLHIQGESLSELVRLMSDAGSLDAYVERYSDYVTEKMRAKISTNLEEMEHDWVVRTTNSLVEELGKRLSTANSDTFWSVLNKLVSDKAEAASKEYIVRLTRPRGGRKMSAAQVKRTEEKMQALVTLGLLEDRTDRGDGGPAAAPEKPASL